MITRGLSPPMEKSMTPLRRLVVILACSISGALVHPPFAPPLVVAYAQEQKLNPLPGNDKPIPVPETAEDIDFDGADGKLEFSSSASVKALAAFYSAAMRQLGWRSQPSVINRSNMAVLEFTKGDKDLTITILQMGDKANVSALGSGVMVAGAKPADTASNEPASADDLKVEDAGGFPVPKKRSMSGSESSRSGRA